MSVEEQKVLINNILESFEVYVCVLAMTAYNCALDSRKPLKSETKVLQENRAKMVDLITENLRVD